MSALIRLVKFFSGDLKDKENAREIFALKMSLPLLFEKKDLEPLNTLFTQLSLYYSGSADFPDLTKTYNVEDENKAIRLCTIDIIE